MRLPSAVLFLVSLLFLTVLPSPTTAYYTNSSSDGSTVITTDPNVISNLGPAPDVYLNVPKLKVGSISLEVDNLQAHVSLQASIASLVTLNAGVDVSIGKVNLTITGVHAQLALIARLDNVARIVNRTLDTLDRNPNLLSNLVAAVGQAVHQIAAFVLNGNAVVQLVDQAGNILQAVYDTAGKLVQPQQIIGTYLTKMVATGVTNLLPNGDTSTQYVYNPYGTLVNVITDATGKVVGTTLA